MRLVRSFIIGAGNGLLILAIVGVFSSLGPFLMAEVKYRLAPKVIPKVVDAAFRIDIPVIKANSLIIDDVDANNPQEYKAALQKGVAHAKGSAYPGQLGTIHLFAHSTDGPWNIARYNAVFYLLQEVSIGDKIQINYLGKEHFYQVTKKMIVPRTRTEIFAQKEEELLILQTCWPPGTTQKAFLILAKPQSY
jgi:sortase A